MITKKLNLLEIILADIQIVSTRVSVTQACNDASTAPIWTQSFQQLQEKKPRCKRDSFATSFDTVVI